MEIYLPTEHVYTLTPQINIDTARDRTWLFQGHEKGVVSRAKASER